MNDDLTGQYVWTIVILAGIAVVYLLIARCTGTTWF
jgi:hypothetical protein